MPLVEPGAQLDREVEWIPLSRRTARDSVKEGSSVCISTKWSTTELDTMARQVRRGGRGGRGRTGPE